jgi:hypothetical protein
MAIDYPGSGKLPNQPMFLEKLDPKIERVLKNQWEEIARYLNKIGASIPHQNENNNTIEIGTSLRGLLPIGTNYNNFNDGRFWHRAGDILLSYVFNNNGGFDFNLAPIITAPWQSGISALIHFTPTVYPDDNGNITFRLRMNNFNLNHSGTTAFSGWGVEIRPGNNSDNWSAMSSLLYGRAGNAGTETHVASVTDSDIRDLTVALLTRNNNNDFPRNAQYSADLLYDMTILDANNASRPFIMTFYGKHIADANYVNVSTKMTANFNYIYHAKQPQYGLKLALRAMVQQSLLYFTGSVVEFEVIRGRVYL